MGEWDSRIPKTTDEVVHLLRRRIEIHARWRDFSIVGSKRAKACEDHGVGTAESHQRYIDQYEGAIAAIKGA